MKRIIIALGLVCLLFIVGCSNYPKIKYETQYLELDEGDLLCLTQEDYKERLSEERQCVELDRCLEGYYDTKCEWLIQHNNDFPELNISGDCR